MNYECKKALLILDSLIKSLHHLFGEDFFDNY